MQLANYLFGPISKEYCFLFYGLSVFYFVLALAILIGLVYTSMSSRRAPSTRELAIAISALVTYLGFYFYNRVLHTMCMK
jgi:hypothetical protein